MERYGAASNHAFGPRTLFKQSVSERVSVDAMTGPGWAGRLRKSHEWTDAFAHRWPAPLQLPGSKRVVPPNSGETITPFPRFRVNVTARPRYRVSVCVIKWPQTAYHGSRENMSVQLCVWVSTKHQIDHPNVSLSTCHALPLFKEPGTQNHKCSPPKRRINPSLSLAPARSAPSCAQPPSSSCRRPFQEAFRELS